MAQDPPDPHGASVLIMARNALSSRDSLLRSVLALPGETHTYATSQSMLLLLFISQLWAYLSFTLALDSA